MIMEIGDIFGANGGGKDVPIPWPNVTVRTGEDTGEWTPEQTRGIICNPIYAGVGPFPALVSDDVWVRSAAVLISKEGPQQFLVNLLFVLRAVFGNVKTGPPVGNSGLE
jgi:hypothetical protein